MKIPQCITAIGVVVLVVLLLAVPQGRRATYNPTSEITVQGTVQEIQDFYCPISGAEGTHLLLATDKGTVQVHVGPKSFLRGNNWNIRVGDHVQVVGSQMRYAGHEAVVARTVSSDSGTISFRKSDGKPLWVD